MQRKRGTGISSEVRHSVRTIAVLLALPVVIGLIVMILYSSRYQAMIGRMDAAAELKPALETTLAEDLFSVAAGRTSFERSDVMRTIRRIDKTLDQLTGQTAGNGHLQLTVARRTMDTMEQYVLQVRDGMEARKPVEEMEQTVDEVRDVGRLIANMLDTFIEEEIANATAASRTLHQWMWVAGGAEVLLLIYALLYSRFKTDRMTSSIRNALSSMENTVRRIAEGRFGDRVSGVDIEELEELGDQINEMANQLETLMQETRQKSDHLAKAELRTMQAQINPHFLYNCLFSLYTLIKNEDLDEAADLTIYLGKYYQLNTHTGEKDTQLYQELECIRMLVKIQNLRSAIHLEYSEDIDDSLKLLTIPRLTLLTVAENFLTHGFKNSISTATLTVTARRRKGWISLIVSDTGSGVDDDQLQEIRHLIETARPEMENVRGLQNALLRFRAIYGPEVVMSVETNEPHGLVVHIDIPDKKEA